jgi:serine/threonine protein kinase
LPTNLIRAHQLTINQTKGKIVNKVIETSREYQNALSDLNYEWNNFILLHFGKHMHKSGMGEPNWTVGGNDVRLVIEEKNKLKKINGYHNIHRILAMDTKVPLLMSEYFDGTVQALSMTLANFHSKIQAKHIFECIIPQTLAGLHYMHDQNVLLAHMDVKPINMLYKFVPGQQHPLIVLCDFGLCVPANQVKNDYYGTPYFMAPEIGKLSNPYVPKYTDVYSWAVSMLSVFHPQVIFGPIKSSLGNALLEKEMSQGDRLLSDTNQEVLQLILEMINTNTPPPTRYLHFERAYSMYFPSASIDEDVYTGQKQTMPITQSF